MIKRIEVNYRGVFQKTLARKICMDIVLIATRTGKVAFSNGRYSDAPERNGMPCKYFAFVSPDLSEEELEAECGAKLDIDEADIIIVLDDTMIKGVEPWAWHGVRSINEKVCKDGCLLVVSRKTDEDLLKFIEKKSFNYRLAILEGDASFSGLWVFKDDLTHERILGSVAALDPEVITIKEVQDYLWQKTQDERRVPAALQAYEAVRVKMVTPQEGIKWPYEKPSLPKWYEFPEGVVVPAVSRGFTSGPGGQMRNERFKHGTAKTERPLVRFDLCTKCTICWLECPDGAKVPTPDGFFDTHYEFCTGCGKCAEVCPIAECIVMVDELKFEDNTSHWEFYKKDPDGYLRWVEEKKGEWRVIYPRITGTGRQSRKGSSVPTGVKRRHEKDG